VDLSLMVILGQLHETKCHINSVASSKYQKKMKIQRKQYFFLFAVTDSLQLWI